MKSFPLWRYGIPLLLIAILGSGGYLIRGRWQNPPGDRLPRETAPTGSGQLVSEMPTEASSPLETIEFPRDAWDSAGLRVQPARQGPLLESIELTGKIALNEDRLGARLSIG